VRLTNHELDYLINLIEKQSKKDPSLVLDSLLLKFTEMSAFRARHHFDENGKPVASGTPAKGASKISEPRWEKIKQAHRNRGAVTPEFGVDEFHPLFRNGDPKVVRTDL